MALIATPARRRMVMIVLLLLAVLGGFIRKFAAPASTLHDVGTLLLVLWLPAVGNLIAYLIRRIPRRPQPAPELPRAVFPAGSAFTPHLQARLEAIGALPAQHADCLLLVAGQAFTARLSAPMAQALAAPQPQPIELLRPAAALPRLAPGTAFHLLVGTTAVATGRVEDAAANSLLP
ncbi:hypothetical protein [Ramlibacter alkalitolerans]|uniref:Uncharacterized protein n=1 Tax=Ramlibacter alkalitolerans TaxID=2039631 RepID=A0ABS1JJA2_9BURK|nr:hypothetical protein [Ramlibacter alkalitolerans]MBL0424310.1 hypothetical protein [Ramlibacter alkalitolerans]